MKRVQYTVTHEMCGRGRVTHACVGVCAIPRECIDGAVRYAVRVRAASVRRTAERLMGTNRAVVAVAAAIAAAIAIVVL